MIANLSSYQRPLTLMIFISVAALAMLFFMRPTSSPATLDPDSLATDPALAPNPHLQAPPSPQMRVTRTDTRLSASTTVSRDDKPVLNNNLEDLVPIEQLKATEEFDFSTAKNNYMYVSVRDAAQNTLAGVPFVIGVSRCSLDCEKDAFAEIGRGRTDRGGKWSGAFTLPTWVKSAQIVLLRPGVAPPKQLTVDLGQPLTFTFVAPSPH